MKRIITLVLMYLSVQMSAQCWQSVSGGQSHTLAIRNDGTLWGWGYNQYGSVGDNTTVTRNVPKQIGTDNKWVKVSTGRYASFGLKSDGTLWSWGSNGGNLGLGGYGEVHTPTQVGTATNWRDVDAGGLHTLALKTDGTLWTWGFNEHGQLGNNTTVNTNVPAQIGTATDWVRISGGDHHSLAIKSNGTLWAWGWNYDGMLGDGTTYDKSIPTQIGTATNWQKITAGDFNSMAIKTDGTLWTWGSNTEGQIGDGTIYPRSTPTQVGTATDWLDVTGGYLFTFAIKTNFSLWSWGRNNSGQLGNGTSGPIDTLIPTQVGTSSDTFKISAGSYHTLAVNIDGFLSGTGSNTFGTIGDGTFVDKNIFTTISCSPVLSAEDLYLDNLKVYPNPVKDILNVSYDKKITSINIYSMVGQQIISKEINAKESKIDTSNLAVGTYLLKVNFNDEVKTLKIVKK